ncbi:MULTISPECIES: hypothetical protein [Thermaceae]|uniref:Uncharacterized protein n=2 Tax=Thermaceae TaxID=188786 RepID=A0A399FDH9_9DEIN|nr:MULTISPECIES: hypothetical protein [Thermaceae]MBI5813071.1 hypothetical protein [Allomeiothermus silvanus]MCL6526414.1 hypothetical protein [Thermaceae bacterium]RIH93489.1 hypothetical protein Mgrana_00543 [Meiothermus granaticius NBRC 107808]RTI03888.1 hypothetical protein CSW30_14235 [Thermus scotoductus]GEM85984.1 hypothetical protein MGR01S_06090 [Meiothermus granaticius NBRC 107808]
MNEFKPFSDPRVRWAAALLMAPFFLQLLGFGADFLGAGLCGDLFGRNNPLGFQSPLFWYAMGFMILLGLQLAYGAILLLVGLLEMPPESARGLFGLGFGLAALIAVLFVLTRTTGIPAPATQGLVFERADLDLLSLLLVGLSLAGGLLLRQMGRGLPPNPPTAA